MNVITRNHIDLTDLPLRSRLSRALSAVLPLSTSFLFAAVLSGCQQKPPEHMTESAPINTAQRYISSGEQPKDIKWKTNKYELIDDDDTYGDSSEEDYFHAEPSIVTSTSVEKKKSFKARRLKQVMVLDGKRDYAGPEENHEQYGTLAFNPINVVAQQPVSTFSIDVDTGAYSKVRSVINSGHLPNKNLIRSEEFINYFSYHYALPKNKNIPFSVHTELALSPWNNDRVLLHLGLQGYDVEKDNLPAANLVFLVDVSGSMDSPNKLGLLKTSLSMLSRNLREQDTVSIVVYAGASGVVLDGAKGNDTDSITQALKSLNAGGGTNGAAGIALAYQIAQKHRNKNGINRVLLATDGDFNVGLSSHDALISMIEQQRENNISLSTLGFGNGNYNDHLMEQLANKGNGNYAYINNLNEARKVLVDEVSSTLNTIAKDVKIQVEFNPALVSEYRLIGYENRLLNREDFNNDKVDAGEIGAGHSVTAIYELTLAGSTPTHDPLRYGKRSDSNNEEKSIKKLSNKNHELAFVKLRYKAPNGSKSKKLQFSVNRSDIHKDLATSSKDFRFSAAVAAFAQKLRNSQYIGEYSYKNIIDLAQSAKGHDRFGYRSEFINVVRTTQAIKG